MRIAFVSDAAYPWHKGGLEAGERVEAEELAKHHEVHFYCNRWPGMEKEFVDKGIHYHTWMKTTDQKFYRHGRRSIRNSVHFAIMTWKLFFSGQKFDLVQANIYPIIHVPILKFYCKLKGIKLVLDVVEVWTRDYWTEYLGGILGRLGYHYTNYFLKSADFYIACSKETADGIAGHDIGKHRVSVFFPILNDEMLASIAVAKKKPQLIYWGRLIKEKRLDKWLHVFAETKKKVKNLRGMLIGDGPEFEGVHEMIKRMKLEGSVELKHSYNDQKELFGTVAQSSALLQMSEREGLSIIVLESVSLGVPVVLPSYTPIPDEVKELCNVDDESKLPDLLAKIVRSKNKSAFIKNTDNLKRFSVSNTWPFYEGLFKKLELD